MTTIAPTPLAARRSKSAGKLPVITLPTGRPGSIRAYVKAWKKLKSVDPETEFGGFDYFPLPAEEILAKFSQGTNDRVNIRGGIRTDWPELKHSRLLRHLERTVKCECRWCGTPLPGYQPKEQRFCSASCRHDHSS